MNTQLEQYYNRVSQCPTCPISAWKDGMIEKGWGQEGKILFIGQAPAYSSFTREPGDSAFDRAFLPLLMRAGITTNDFFFTNLCKAPPAGDIRSLPRTDRLHLASHLAEEIQLIDPVVVVSLGDIVFQVLLDLKFPNKMSMPHPGTIKYGHMTDGRYVDQLRKVKERYIQLSTTTQNAKQQ